MNTNSAFRKQALCIALATAGLLASSPSFSQNVITGIDNFNAGMGSTVTGSNNQNQGDLSTVTGIYNFNAGVDSTVTGSSNQNQGDRSTVTGVGNSVYAADGIAMGSNIVIGDQTLVCPGGTVRSISDQTVCSASGSGLLGDAGVVLPTLVTTGVGSIGFGANVKILGDRTVAVGFNAGGAAGVNDAGAFGSNSIATESNTISFGSVGYERRLTNVAAGVNATDAVNKAQLDAVAATATAAQTAAAAAQATADMANTRALTPGATGAQGVAGVAGVAGAKGDTGLTGAAAPVIPAVVPVATALATVTGTSRMGPQATNGQVSNLAASDGVVDHAVVGANGAITFSNSAVAAAQVSMTLTNGIGNTHGIVIQEAQTVLSGGTHSTTLTLADNGASFANAQTGAAVVISGVANGVATTDAANVGQVSTAIDAAVASLDARLTSVEGNIKQLDQKIDDVERKLSGGIAIATALTQPMSFASGAKNAVTGGIATYNGQSAVAFGFNRLVQASNERRTILSAGVGFTTSGQSAARVGASFSW